MNKSREKNNNEFELDVMRKITNKPDITQRELAKQLGHSLGKLNFCLKELQNKGFIKIENFKKNPNKINYFYVLAPKGLAQKTKLTLNYMKRKISNEEYQKDNTRKMLM